jgi:hypothetical protein
MARDLMRALLVAGAMWSMPGFALDDPTALPLPAAPGIDTARPALAVTAIKRSGGVRLAVVNGREVRVCDRLPEGRVVKIGEDAVVLRQGREVSVLRLYPQVDRRIRKP